MRRHPTLPAPPRVPTFTRPSLVATVKLPPEPRRQAQPAVAPPSVRIEYLCDGTLRDTGPEAGDSASWKAGVPLAEEAFDKRLSSSFRAALRVVVDEIGAGGVDR